MGKLDLQSRLDFDMEEAFADVAISSEFSPQLFLVPTDLQMNSWRYRGVKRAIDVLCSTLLMTICLVPGLLIAAAIALTSEGPVFYSEIRVGRGKRPFRIWKFRSMRTKGSGHDRMETVSRFEVLSRWRTEKDLHDPRITRVWAVHSDLESGRTSPIDQCFPGRHVTRRAPASCPGRAAPV